MVGLTGKVAIVTGGGRGLGRAIAMGMASVGAKVVVADFFVDDAGKAAADAVADEIVSAGGEAVGSSVDISVWDGGEKLVSAAVEAFGRVDILVMCAGNLNVTSTRTITEAEWDFTMNVHVKQHVACSQAATRQMIAQGDGGRIIMFSSRAAFFGASPAYPAAKAAIMGMSSALAREFAKDGITVNCMLPSAQTQLFPGDISSRPVAAGHPRADDISPETICPVINYLTSDEGGVITGRFIYATGGDVCFYDPPLELGDRPVFLRSRGGWTSEQLHETIPVVLGLNK